jgi:hypothetical protein
MGRVGAGMGYLHETGIHCPRNYPMRKFNKIPKFCIQPMLIRMG